MNADLKRRLAALEAQAPDTELVEIDGYLRIGRGLYVPPPMDPDDWAAACAEQQRDSR